MEFIFIFTNPWFPASFAELYLPLMYCRQIYVHCRFYKKQWIIFCIYWILQSIHLRQYMISSLIGQDL